MDGQRKDYFPRELAEHREFEFIEDGEKKKIECSACGCSLIEIWIVRPNAPLTTEMIVDCPLCGDKSFKKVIKGQYCIGHLENSDVIMVDTPTEIDEDANGNMLQKIHVKTRKR